MEATQLLKNIQAEIRLIRQRLEAIEEALSEEMSADDLTALREAEQEHKKGETISLDEAARRLTQIQG